MALAAELKRELTAHPEWLVERLAAAMERMTSYRVQRAFREATAALGELVKLEQQFGIERALQIAHRQIKHDGDHQGPRESDT